MLSENRAERNQMEMFCIDSFVPEDHLLRKIDEALDFGRIYEIVGDLYCHNNGRPSVDPVVLFKIVFIQHLYGIPSLRRTCEEIKMNVAYRWFLGYLMNEQLPHFSTVSQNFKATPHKARLTAWRHICLHLFRHLAQKFLAGRQPSGVISIQSDEKSDCASAPPALCGVA